MGRPTIPEETRKALVSFLERPDISYCKPGRGDTVYCGKNQAGEKIYKSKHYLLWTLKELVEIFNIDNSIQASYYFMQKTVESEKHIFKIGDTAEDDCRCDKCENVELLLISVKNTLKDSHPDLVTSYCCNDVCSECPGNIVIINPIAAILEKVDEISYAKWVYDGRYKKIECTDRGADVAELLREIASCSFKCHVYNIFSAIFGIKTSQKST